MLTATSKKKKKELGADITITFSWCNYNYIDKDIDIDKDTDHMNTLDTNFIEIAVNENCEITKTFFSDQCIYWNQYQGDFFFKKMGATPYKAEQPLQGMES